MGRVVTLFVFGLVLLVLGSASYALSQGTGDEPPLPVRKPLHLACFAQYNEWLLHVPQLDQVYDSPDEERQHERVIETKEAYRSYFNETYARLNALEECILGKGRYSEEYAYRTFQPRAPSAAVTFSMAGCISSSASVFSLD